ENGFSNWELSTTEPHNLGCPSSLGPQLPFSDRTNTPPQPCPNSDWKSGSLPTRLKLAEPLYSIFNFPARPFLVVIIIAPFRANPPYKEDAAVPFRMVMLSISFGLMSFMPLPKSVVFVSDSVF